VCTTQTRPLDPSGTAASASKFSLEPSKAESKKKAKAERKAVVEELFDFWKALFDHPTAKLSDQRRRKTELALSSFTTGELYQSLAGYKEDDWEPRLEKLHNHDLTVLFRDIEHVERGLDIYRQYPNDCARHLPLRERVLLCDDWDSAFRSGLLSDALGLDATGRSNLLLAFHERRLVPASFRAFGLCALLRALRGEKPDGLGKALLAGDEPPEMPDMTPEEQDVIMGLVPRPRTVQEQA